MFRELIVDGTAQVIVSKPFADDTGDILLAIHDTYGDHTMVEIGRDQVDDLIRALVIVSEGCVP